MENRKWKRKIPNLTASERPVSVWGGLENGEWENEK